MTLVFGVFSREKGISFLKKGTACGYQLQKMSAEKNNGRANSEIGYWKDQINNIAVKLNRANALI